MNSVSADSSMSVLFAIVGSRFPLLLIAALIVFDNSSLIGFPLRAFHRQRRAATRHPFSVLYDTWPVDRRHSIAGCSAFHPARKP
jgi:hypothetical protein